MALVMDTRPAAYCVIVRDAHILLTHYRTTTPENVIISGWSLPGGGMEIGEQPVQTALREVFEETGYKAEIERLVGVHAGYFDRPDATVFCSLRTIFSASVVSGELTVETDGSTTDVRWVPLEELENYIPEPSSSDISPHLFTVLPEMMGFNSSQEWAEIERAGSYS